MLLLNPFWLLLFVIARPESGGFDQFIDLSVSE